MAENLMARGKLTGSEIKGYVDQFIEPIVKQNNNPYVLKALNDLRQLQSESIKLEKRAYAHFQVGSIEELQKKIDDVNASGLNRFSNAVLKTMPAITETKEGVVKKEEVIQAVDQVFTDYLKSQKGEKSLEEYIDSLTEKELNRFYNSIEGKSRRNKFITKGKSKDGKTILMYNIQGSVKRSLAKEYGIKAKVEHKDDDIVVTFDGVGRPVSVKMNRYPYFQLTPEEQEEAKQNIPLWNNFKLMLTSCVSDARAKSALRWVLDNEMGVGEFVSTGGSYNDIIGILGELQALTIVKYLLPNASIANARFLGHELNKDGKKIGIDLALNQIGFQIKNYSIINTKDGNGLINLGGDVTLKNFLNTVDRTFGSERESMRTSLEGFYALSAYHIFKNSEFKETRTRMDQLEKDELPRIYHGIIADLLPLKGIQLAAGGGSQNVFYLVGGTKILPVSVILERFIRFLEKIKDGRKIFTMRIEYKGPTEVSDKENNSAFVGYGKVVDKIGVHYNVNLSLSTSLKDLINYG